MPLNKETCCIHYIWNNNFTDNLCLCYRDNAVLSNAHAKTSNYGICSSITNLNSSKLVEKGLTTVDFLVMFTKFIYATRQLLQNIENLTSGWPRAKKIYQFNGNPLFIVHDVVLTSKKASIINYLSSVLKIKVSMKPHTQIPIPSFLTFS